MGCLERYDENPAHDENDGQDPKTKSEAGIRNVGGRSIQHLAGAIGFFGSNHCCLVEQVTHANHAQPVPVELISAFQCFPKWLEQAFRRTVNSTDAGQMRDITEIAAIENGDPKAAVSVFAELTPRRMPWT
jgi:hypothetical protein